MDKKLKKAIEFAQTFRVDYENMAFSQGHFDYLKEFDAFVGEIQPKKPMTVVEYLTTLSKNGEDFNWEANEDMRSHEVTIKTSRELSVEERSEIERLGTFYGGPIMFCFIHSYCCYKDPEETECHCYWCTT